MKFTDNFYFRKVYFTLPMLHGAALREVYVSLIKGDTNILIDTGVAYHYEDLEQMIASAGMDFSDIQALINTHCHFDHVGGNYGLKKKNPHISIWAHGEAKPFIEDLDYQYKVRPLPGFNTLTGGSVKVDRVLNDGEILDVGFPVQVLHTPGHSPGSLSLYIPDQKLAIIGDSLPDFKGLPIYEDLDELYITLQKIKDLQPRFIFSSFFGMWDQEKDGDVLLIIEKYLTKIQEAVNEYTGNHKDYEINKLCQYVLQSIEVDSPVIPLLIKSVQEHVKRSS